MKKTYIYFTYDIKNISSNNINLFFPILIFLLISTTIFFTLQDSSNQQEYLLFIFPVALLIANTTSINSIINEDYQDGTMSNLLFSGISELKIIIVKTLTHWFTVNIPIFALFSVLCYFSIPKLMQFSHIIYISILLTLILSSLTTLSSMITIDNNYLSGALGMIIILPLSISIIIIYNSIIKQILVYTSPSSYFFLLEIMSAIAVLNFITNSYFGAILLKEALKKI